jgi:long-chain acyl-CoA synthetase
MLKDLILSQVKRQPDAVALQIKIAGQYRRWTRSELWSKALAVAGTLRSHGVTSGTRVGLFAENSPEWIFAYLGIYFSGAVIVPLDAQYTELELNTILNFADCSIVLCGGSKRSIVEKIASVKTILEIDGETDLYNATPIEEPATRPADDLMAIIFTSGTTGDPKGVRLSVGNITSNILSARTLSTRYVKRACRFFSACRNFSKVSTGRS